MRSMANDHEKGKVQQLLEEKAALPDPLLLLAAIRKDTAACVKVMLQKHENIQESEEDKA